MPTFKEELNWALLHMPRTQKTLENLPDLSNVRLACNMHLDLKIVPFVEWLLKKGAKIHLTTCNPTTVKDEVVDYLKSRGAETYAWCNMDAKSWEESVIKALDWNPTQLCEMGASITTKIHSDGYKYTHNIKAGLEATGSGINRLKKLKPYYPIFNWDDLPVKEGLHNRHMVGLTACHTFFNVTRLTMHEKVVLVVGYGLVGQGVADSAKAYGGQVIVADLDPSIELQAKYNGFRVTNLEEGIKEADVIITATGAKNVISSECFKDTKDGVFILNVGHEAEEIDIKFLQSKAKHFIPMPFVDSYELNNKKIFVLANGSMVNLTAGYGDSLNAFDVTLAVMSAGIKHIITEGEKAEPDLYLIPTHAWIDSVR